MDDNESDATVFLDVFEVDDLMFVDVFERERGFRSCFFRFEVDVLALVDAIVIRCGRNFVICLADFRGTSAFIIDLHDLDGNRFLVDVGDVVCGIIGIGVVDGLLQIHTAIGDGYLIVLASSLANGIIHHIFTLRLLYHR